MNGTPRRPLTPLEKACPPIREAYEAFERALVGGNDAAIGRAWRQVEQVRDAYALGQAGADTV